MNKVVIDTNILVSAIMNSAGAPRQVVRMALRRRISPLMGNALFSEYEDVLARDELWSGSPLNRDEREMLLDALMSVCLWTPIYYLWRPNLPDEADNHLLELAIAGGAHTIITANTRDFRRSELRFPNLRIATAGEFIDQRIAK